MTDTDKDLAIETIDRRTHQDSALTNEIKQNNLGVTTKIETIDKMTIKVINEAIKTMIGTNTIRIETITKNTRDGMIVRISVRTMSVTDTIASAQCSDLLRRS